MSKRAALDLIDSIEAILNDSRPTAEAKNLGDYYKRDIHFVEEARRCLTSDDRQEIQWVFDQMRNVSQGFGSYCSDLKALDTMLDRLFAELEDALS